MYIFIRVVYSLKVYKYIQFECIDSVA